MKHFLHQYQITNCQKIYSKKIIDENPNFDRFSVFKFGERLNLSKYEISLIIERYIKRAKKLIIEAPEINGSKAFIKLAKEKKYQYLYQFCNSKIELMETVNRRGIDILSKNIFGRPLSKQQNMKNIILKEKKLKIF